MSFTHRPSKKRRLSSEHHGESSSRDRNNAVLNDEKQSRPSTVEAVKRRTTQASRHVTSKTSNGHETVNAGQLYGSNSLKLQLDDLLDGDRMKSTKSEAQVNDVLRRLKGIIEAIPETEAVPMVDAEKRLLKTHKIAIPFPDPRPNSDSNYKLQFCRPSHVNVVGSYPLKFMSKHRRELRVDMLVTMPVDMFQEKDYLDYRYFYRRAYYVAYIATAIRSSGDNFEVTFDYLDGNYLQPVVRVDVSSSVGSSSKKTVVRIIPGLPDGAFPAKRTLPTNSLVRQLDSSDSGLVNDSKNVTSFYNGSLRSDALFTSYLKLLSETLKTCDGFKDACTLGRIWLRRRGFTSDVRGGGFGNFEWACITALLVENNSTGKGFLSPGYSSYQLFKATLQFLASRDLAKVGYGTLPSAISLPLSGDQPCFYDAERCHNVLYKMTSWSYSKLRQEAKTGTDALANSARDPFEAIFLADTQQSALQYDLVIKLDLFQVAASRIDLPTSPLAGLEKLYTVLRKALTDRIQLLDLRLSSLDHWSLTTALPSTSTTEPLIIGLITDPAQSSRAMDRGPSMENKKDVKAYLNFWGQEKAVRMKFGNESPIETVTWELAGKGPSVLEQIITHTLQRHIGKEVADTALIVADPYTTHIKDVQRPLGYGTGARAILTTAFSVFERELRSLEGLPLQIRQILPADSALRYADLSITSGGSKFTPLDVVVQFEGSGRWPDDLSAIQRTKVAFLLKLRDIYETSHDGVTSYVRLENQEDSITNQAYLDVAYAASQVVFRIRIHHERELALLESKVKDRSASSYQKERFARALAKYKRDFVHRPAHTQALQTLCTRLPSLSPAIKLTKAWFAAHLLLGEDRISEELVELMVVRAFTTPWPWEVPGSASTAFARTIRWLANWDWKSEPLIVDLQTSSVSITANDTVSHQTHLRAADIDAIETRSDAWRRIDPMLNRVVIFAASSIDREGTTWTDQNCPAKVVAARMTRLAQAASKLMDTGDEGTLSEALFTPNLEDFDFVLHLNAKLLYGASKQRADSFKNLELQGIADARAELANISPVSMFTKELRDVHGDSIIFFNDQRGGSVLAGLWNPAMSERSWKVKLPVSTIPSLGHAPEGGDQSSLVQMNKAATIREIARVGGDLVESISIQTPL